MIREELCTPFHPEEREKKKSRNVSVPRSWHVGNALHFLNLIETIHLHCGWVAAAWFTRGYAKVHRVELKPCRCFEEPVVAALESLHLLTSHPVLHLTEGVCLLSQSQGSPSCLCTRQRRTLFW